MAGYGGYLRFQGTTLILVFGPLKGQHASINTFVFQISLNKRNDQIKKERREESS